MKYLLLLCALCLCNLCTAQFSCDNIELKGIYTNNFNVYELSLVITNKNTVNDENGNVYTGFHIITEAGDTLSTQPCYCFKLPNSNQETIVYRIPIESHIYDLPNEFCGKIVTEFPSCEIPFCKSFPFNNVPSELPIRQYYCNDYEIVDIHLQNYDTGNSYTVLITMLDPTHRTYPSAYTTLSIENYDGELLTNITGPNFSMPMFSTDTIAIHLQAVAPLPNNFCGILVTGGTGPFCDIDICAEPTNISYLNNTLNAVVFPNPSDGLFEITLNNTPQITEANLYNLAGKLIKTIGLTETDFYNSTEKFTLNVNGTAGVYFLELKTDDVVQTLKLVKY